MLVCVRRHTHKYSPRQNYSTVGRSFSLAHVPFICSPERFSSGPWLFVVFWLLSRFRFCWRYVHFKWPNTFRMRVEWLRIYLVSDTPITLLLEFIRKYSAEYDVWALMCAFYFNLPLFYLISSKSGKLTVSQWGAEWWEKTTTNWCGCRSEETNP